MTGLGLLLALCATACVPRAEEGKERDPALLVLAAASLQDALPPIAERWTQESGVPVRFSFDATSRLARQVETGATADVFFSADQEWMDRLLANGHVRADSRRQVARNRLVVVARAEVDASAGDPARPLRLPPGPIALAGENVPAGRAAEAALRALGAWEALAPRVVRADHVRAALAWVERGEAEAGFVYATDVSAAKGLHVLAAVPEELTPGLQVQAAVLTRSEGSSAARAFIEASVSGHGREALRARGFLDPEERP